MQLLLAADTLLGFHSDRIRLLLEHLLQRVDDMDWEDFCRTSRLHCWPMLRFKREYRMASKPALWPATYLRGIDHQKIIDFISIQSIEVEQYRKWHSKVCASSIYDTLHTTYCRLYESAQSLVKVTIIFPFHNSTPS